MAWNIIRNSEPSVRIDSFPGKCPKYDKNANISIKYFGSYYCKTDLHKTYHEAGRTCDLLEGDTKISRSCLENCPLVPKE